mmetsp:Transcript_30304/g.104659  ORF Transcript_30304/g.104659 Transcript_30304/m.104659 type:complete len:277 (-) Transcript_30304:304-1134(-)
MTTRGCGGRGVAPAFRAPSKYEWRCGRRSGCVGSDGEGLCLHRVCRRGASLRLHEHVVLDDVGAAGPEAGVVGHEAVFGRALVGHGRPLDDTPGTLPGDGARRRDRKAVRVFRKGHRRTQGALRVRARAPLRRRRLWRLRRRGRVGRKTSVRARHVVPAQDEALARRAGLPDEAADGAVWRLARARVVQEPGRVGAGRAAAAARRLDDCAAGSHVRDEADCRGAGPERAFPRVQAERAVAEVPDLSGDDARARDHLVALGVCGDAAAVVGAAVVWS